MNIFYNAERTIKIDHRRRNGYFTMMSQHTHAEYELYYLIEGERDFFIRNRTYRVNEGSFVFVNKDELHRTIDTGVLSHERVVINFAEKLLSGFPLSGRNGVVVFPKQEHGKAESLVQELLAEAMGNAAGREVMLETLLRQLLLQLFRAQAERTEPEWQPSITHRTMSEIAGYVGEHYAEALLLKDVAKRFFISPYYLSRKFKLCTGFGFAEYVQYVRIREAERLLRDTELKIIDVAERSGIGPVAHFHKLFKKMNSCTPLQYRKSIRALQY